MLTVALATEDELSEAVGRRLLRDASTNVVVGPLLRKSGFGYLRSRMDSWCSVAERQPLVLLTDLDRAPCAPSLIRTWLGDRKQPRGLIVRVAVREVEAWLLADHVAMEGLLGSTRLPENPDAVPDPKRHLLDLARHASRKVRSDLLVPGGAIASQGLGYNNRMCAFVEDEWSPRRAAKRSDSLRRALERIGALAARA